MIISLIVAIAKDNAIGKNNDLLWHLPKDMKFFKETTNGHCIITGRKNYFSIPEKFRPLPNRTNIVLTRSKDLNLEGAVVINDIKEGIKIAQEKGEEELFIIGGGEIYNMTLPLVDRMYITVVDTQYPMADTFFPSFDASEWEVEVLEKHSKDEKHAFDFEIQLLSRK